MSATPRKPEELLAQAVRASHAATIDKLGLQPVLWLAASPVWTRGVAEEAGFPAQDLTRFIQEARDAGWCKTRGQDAAADLLFWMPDEARRPVINVIRDRLGVRQLQVQVARTAEYVLLRMPGDSSGDGPGIEEVPGALREWATLMAGADDPPSGIPLAFVDLVSAAVRERDLSAAQDLVTAGEAMACVVAGPAEQALSRARRLLALGRRRRQDERALRRYLDRPELTDAVTRLLDQRDGRDLSPWALHLRGVGGIGKTMLIRYLASGRYARDRGVDPIPLARTDFDHVSPDYPVRHPVQLLLELADELALHTAANYQADQALTAFRARAARAHEAVSGLREAGAPPLGNPEVARAVDDFGTVLSALGDVLLILDTCEELAKADMGNPAAPAVRATLDILERLHEKAPSVRVLFAGRRPLPVRGYLVVQPVAGFTVAEARRYLAREYVARQSPDARHREPAAARPLPPGLADAMIRQSPALDGPVPREGQLPERVSPFDLALYAAWADGDPGLDVAQVNRGSDAYIEGRIIERLDDPLVVRALPALACAGRCRVATIAEYLNCDAATLGQSLAAQEWIDAVGSPASGTGHVAATPALARRLRRYFGQDERRAGFAAHSAALASFLVPRLRDTTLADVDVDELIAALRLSPPAEAASLWDSVADRAMEPPGRWGTVLNMTRRILGEWEPGDGWHSEWEDGTWPTMPALRATVVAAHIAGSRRDSPLFDPRGLWGSVRRWAGRHPDPGRQRELTARAIAGLLPSAPDDESLWAILREAADAGSRKSPVLHAAFVDAAHRLLEAGLDGAADRLSRDWGLLATPGIFEAQNPRFHAWALITLARLNADRAPGVALDHLTGAGSRVMSSEPEPSWPDSILPADLLARIRIEHGLIAPPDDPSVLDEWQAYAADHLDTIDGERLASLCLRIALRHGVVDESVAQRWEALDAYTPDRAPTCSAHDLVPPLCVSVAEAWMSAGEPDRALDLLGRRRREALGTRLDEVTVRHADAATVKIVRRLRLETQLSLLYRLESRADATVDRWQLTVRHAAWRAKAIVHRQPPDLRQLLRSGEQPPAAWHAWWQSQIGNWQAVPVDAFLRPATDVAPPGPPVPADPDRTAQRTLDDADLVADLEEMLRLGHPGLAGREHLAAGVLSGRAPARPPARSAEPCDDVRAAMRRAALRDDDFTPRPGIPPRLLGEMAFEEAELTALRLPAVAVRLYDIAACAYDSAGDQVWHLLARASQAAAVGHLDSTLSAVTSAALSTLGAESPVLAAKLSGPVEDAGRWRYWAQRVQQPVARATPPVTDPGETAEPPGSGSGRSVPPGSAAGPSADGPSHAARPWIRAAYLAVTGFLLALAGLSVAALTGSHANYLPIAIVVAVTGVLAVLLAWQLPKIARLARGRGVGGFRLGALQFEVGRHGWPQPGGGRPLRGITVDVGLRPTRTAPLRIRGLISLVEPAVWLAAILMRNDQYGNSRFRGRPGGYLGDVLAEGSPALPVSVTWMDARTAASARWWRRGRGTAAGTIWCTWGRNPELLAAPWERILSASLAPGAAGRVEWVRVVQRDILDSFGPGGNAVRFGPVRVLQGPSDWISSLGAHYEVVSGQALPALPSEILSTYTELHHLIGRAVRTAAGPAMDISGDASALAPGSSAGSPAESAGLGSHSILSVQDITDRAPRLVILQAEPVADDIPGDPPADQAEKLALAAALATDGVPAVLLLPALPAAIAGEIASAVTTHPTSLPGDVQRLLTRLRAIIAPHVPPQVLDDIVLFVDDSRYRQ